MLMIEMVVKSLDYKQNIYTNFLRFNHLTNLSVALKLTILNKINLRNCFLKMTLYIFLPKLI